MTSVLAFVAILVPAVLLYSPKVEQNRIVTITRPLLITQERKTPAYYLYQQVKVVEKEAPSAAAALTTYLSSQSYVPPETAVAMNELRVDRREIASEVDAGFNTTALQLVNDEEDPLRAIANMIASQKQNFESATPPAKQPEPTQLSPGTKWATIRGKFESYGVGFIDQIIELKRVEEGQVRELGRIDLKAGLYSIDIQSPRGTLIAEVRDRNGVRIGIAEQKIENLVSRGQYFEGPLIQVRQSGSLASYPNTPASPRSGGTARAASFVNLKTQAHSPKKPPEPKSSFVTTLFSNQNILENPKDEFSNVAKYASTVSYVTDQTAAYRKVLTIRQTGDTSETPLFSEKWVQGLLEYISNRQKIEFKSDQISIVIGRAMIDGKSAAGVQMQIENHPGVYPIYLDQFLIPNAKQTETSENGYFMFLGLEDASYTITAFKQSQIIGHQMFIAEQGSISFQNVMSKGKPESIVVRAFDAFTAEPVDIDLTTPDLEEVIQTTVGTANYRSHSTRSISQFLVRTNSEGYYPIRYIQDSRKDYVHIPMIREDWLKQIQAQRLINENGNASTFVGFVPDIDYQVYLVHEGYSKDQVVYFDPQGRLSPIPVRGGGFILYNVPKEAREVIVQQEGTDRIFSQVFESLASQVTVAHFVD